MNLTLPLDLRRYIDDQVKAGRFATPEAVVEAAIVNMRNSRGMELDDDTIAAINEGEDQADRGEGIELTAFREHWKKKLEQGR